MSELHSMTDSKPNDNGAGLPSVIEYQTQSGVLIYVTPLSLFTIQAIINKSESDFPYPDEKEYRLLEMEVDGVTVQAVDTIASGYFPATENPEYNALCKAVDQQRVEWQNDAIIELACKYPQWESREAMMDHFSKRLRELRPFVELGDDDWTNTLEHCVFTGYADVTDENGKRVRTPERFRVIQLARQNSNLALTMSEVIGSFRVFRIQLPGGASAALAGSGTRGLEKRD